jgi:hypothetical protein
MVSDFFGSWFARYLDPGALAAQPRLHRRRETSLPVPPQALVQAAGNDPSGAAPNGRRAFVPDAVVLVACGARAWLRLACGSASRSYSASRRLTRGPPIRSLRQSDRDQINIRRIRVADFRAANSRPKARCCRTRQDNGVHPRRAESVLNLTEVRNSWPQASQDQKCLIREALTYSDRAGANSMSLHCGQNDRQSRCAPGGVVRVADWSFMVGSSNCLPLSIPPPSLLRIVLGMRMACR